jgi:hypothetical protein
VRPDSCQVIRGALQVKVEVERRTTEGNKGIQRRHVIQELYKKLHPQVYDLQVCSYY